MLPDRVSNPGPLTYESGALSIALRGPAQILINALGRQYTFGFLGLDMRFDCICSLPLPPFLLLSLNMGDCTFNIITWTTYITGRYVW